MANAYQIESEAGVVLGIYKGADEQEAYEALCHDAGAPPVACDGLIFVEIEQEGEHSKRKSVQFGSERGHHVADRCDHVWGVVDNYRQCLRCGAPAKGAPINPAVLDAALAEQD